MHLFCFGLGYVSSYIIDELENSNCLISGSHTGKRKLASNEYIFNDSQKFDSEILKDVTHILISVPSTSKGDPVFLEYSQKIKNLKHLKWIGYFSSTSVYGDHQGNWVDEKSIPDDSDILGKNRLIAEEQWLESKMPVNIFRLSSIYGPGRSVIDAIKLGKAMRIFKENHYFSRIHVKDIASIIIKVIQEPILGEIYNIADNFPSPHHEAVEFGCKLLGIEPPAMINFQDAELSEMMVRYYSSSKKVNNNKVKEAYNIELAFPSYKEGLITCL